MKSLEIEGKTIDEAIGKACEELGVNRDKVNIEIISEGTSGFLGIGNKKAKIKATILAFDDPFSDAILKSNASSPSGPQAAAPTTPAAEVECGDDALRAKELLEGMLQRMSLDCPVSVRETEESITLNIVGNGEGLLIGRRGQNLDAFQYIINKAIHKSNNGRKRIIVDTESYRQRREESLVALAEKIGARVKKTRKAVTLSYLNAHNRRIIHMTLQNDAAVITKSRGEGEYRKIVIVPAKKG